MHHPPVINMFIGAIKTIPKLVVYYCFSFNHISFRYPIIIP